MGLKRKFCIRLATGETFRTRFTNLGTNSLALPVQLAVSYSPCKMPIVDSSREFRTAITLLMVLLREDLGRLPGKVHPPTLRISSVAPFRVNRRTRFVRLRGNGRLFVRNFIIAPIHSSSRLPGPLELDFETFVGRSRRDGPSILATICARFETRARGSFVTRF